MRQPPWLKENPFKEILLWVPDYRPEKSKLGSNWSSIIQPFTRSHTLVGEVVVIMQPKVACLYCNLSKTYVRKCRTHRASKEKPFLALLTNYTLLLLAERDKNDCVFLVQKVLAGI